ncbi:3'(2'),5'-bisphosphate nucleotidase CysQ [Bacillus haikouensis]|uniref:3'(2'),5'-bisphosphate nucleotidase CysQ n=1 Tax=Bacillus haikouensis TaxID=1510468 RepID=UPI001554623F|nr:3'(2'),5'-bisphosphate nucleotidase CysQ [Bacillus haikouensis]NQD68541.1 3'(2'),5'-bisphosphate nucleotidase CysQ [Bacillus haikouensis]
MLKKLIEIALMAGQQMMTVYQKDFQVERKSDDSPLTCADRLSQCIIQKELKVNWPDIPILSEEGASIPYQERASWEKFWLVDPLDGTKEFIKKNGEFTVNIALIQKGKPVIGVIYAPALDILYYAEENEGAFKDTAASKKGTQRKRLHVDLVSKTKKVVVSRSHMSNETVSYVKRLENQEEILNLISIGSSLKFCLVAEGTAHYYPRLAPTMEWDTAAGHCIAVEAGCQVLDYQTSAPLTYNKEVLVNPWFICSI